MSTLTVLLIGLGAGCASPPVRDAPSSAIPDWVENGGRAGAYPDGRFVSGFGMEIGESAAEAARARAAGDLATRISVRIEHELRDVSAEEDGEYRYRIAAVTRSSADIRLSGLHFEEYRLPEADGRERMYALATVERAPAAARRRAARDDSLSLIQSCLARSDVEHEAGRGANALASYESCRKPLAEAAQHAAVARALVPGEGEVRAQDRAASAELLSFSRRLDERILALHQRAAKSLDDAVERLSLQLATQGVDPGAPLTVAPLTVGNTDLSSGFGRRIALDLEAALRRRNGTSSLEASEATPATALRGFYLEEGEEIRLSVTARDVASGDTLAHAESRLQKSAVPAELVLRPMNFEEALRDQNLLAEGEIHSGDLRIELWTDRGRRGVLYAERESLKLFFRVNRSAWVRIIYVLQNGMQVPIEDGYHVTPPLANRVVEYPAAFEVVPPFGVEHIYATAFTEEPPPLATRRVILAGEPYDIIADGMQSLVRTRGLRRKAESQLAESYVTVTTTPAE